MYTETAAYRYLALALAEEAPVAPVRLLFVRSVELLAHALEVGGEHESLRFHDSLSTFRHRITAVSMHLHRSGRDAGARQLRALLLYLEDQVSEAIRSLDRGPLERSHALLAGLVRDWGLTV